MGIAEVEREILVPMQRLYLPPRNMDEAQQTAALREYGAALEGFARADLAAAWASVRDTHQTRGWPVPGAFVMAARAAAKAAPHAEPALREGHAERWQRWRAICRSALGREAVERGVAWSLRCAVLQDGKRAEEIDLRELVLGKQRAERTAHAIARGQGVEFAGRTLIFKEADAAQALKLYEALRQREAETEMEIRP